MLLFFLIFMFICLLLFKRAKKNAKPTKKNSPDSKAHNHISSYAISQNDRWDLRTLMKDSEDPEIKESFRQISKKITKAPFLRWILTESPKSLALFAIHNLREEEPSDATPDVTYEFWKFMQAPGAEITLTEAAYKGYLPAMSILASYYEDKGCSEEAEYWQKVGVAYLNPTSILLYGLNLLIQGKLNNNISLSDQGTTLIALSHLLGEEIANKIPGVESLANAKINDLDSYSKKDISKYIYEIEKSDEEKIVHFLTEIHAILSDSQVKATDTLNAIQKINTVLDNQNVSIMEISHLLPLRNMMVDELKQQLSDNLEFIDALEKAEVAWKYQRVGSGSDFIKTAIIPMMFET